MKQDQIEILREVFEEWLLSHNLDYEFWIYTGDEWRARGEKVLPGADVVLAFENQLVNLLERAGTWDIEDELRIWPAGSAIIMRWGSLGTLGSIRSPGLKPCPHLRHLIYTCCNIPTGTLSGGVFCCGAAGAAKSVEPRGSRSMFITVITATADCRGNIPMERCWPFALVANPFAGRPSCGSGCSGLP